MKKSIAFTLAEVLIVLGVIGIVAEMTIPTLVKNTEKIEYTSRYKKAYATLSEAMLSIKQEQGGTFTPESWYIEQYGGDGTHDQNMENDFKAYLKTAKECPPNSAGETDCFSTGLYKYLNNKATFEVPSDTWFYSVVLADGTAIRFNPPYECAFGDNCQMFLEVDLNGAKKPNTFGKDYHRLLILEDGKIVAELYDQSVELIKLYCDGNTPNSWGNTCGVKMLNGTY